MIERSAIVSGNLPMHSDGERRIGGERARLMVVANGAQHRAAPAMAAVEDAAQLVIFAQERVGFIDQQCRPISFDHAKQPLP